MKNIKSLAVAVLMGATSAHAEFDLDHFYPSKTCTAQFGEGYSWLVFTYVHLGATRNNVVEISVPYGPGGTYISQQYLQSRHLITRAGMYHAGYEKFRQPTGPQAEKWANWFPEGFYTETGSYNGVGPEPNDPTYITFKGARSKLDCQE